MFWYKHWSDLGKAAKQKKNKLEKVFLKVMNKWVVRKTIKNVRKHNDLQQHRNLQQHRKSENIWCQNQTVILKSFSQKIY